MGRFISVPISPNVSLWFDRKEPFSVEIHQNLYSESIPTNDIVKMAEFIKDVTDEDGQIDFDRVKKQG